MPDENKRESGARHPKTRRYPDPNEAVSQKAAENRKPPSGVGLTEKVDATNEKTRHSDGRDTPMPHSKRATKSNGR